MAAAKAQPQRYKECNTPSQPAWCTSLSQPAARSEDKNEALWLDRPNDMNQFLVRLLNRQPFANS